MPVAALVALAALSMSIGWRIRGQFGHEIGAALAGALGAMAVVLVSGRPDWHRRVHYFALLGALGWSFGGSMSYMKVVGYCHSSDSATVLYGFAGLFLIGFLWAAMGGAGVSLAAVLSSERLAGLFPALAAVFSAWFLQDIAVDLYRARGGGSLNWFDSDWLGAAAAILAALLMALVRRRFELGTSLVLHMAIGWWVAFVALIVLLGWRINPPRGENWAGCVGLFAGLMLFCRRHRLGDVARTALVTGFLGATGFSLGQMIKLALISTGAQFGWHAVMEWTQGLFYGAALGIAMIPMIRRGPQLEDRPTYPRWTEIFPVFFLLCVMPYLNFRRSPTLWDKHLQSLPENPYGIALVTGFAPSRGWIGWLEMVFLALGAVLVWLLARHLRRPSPLVPESWLGKGQLLYLAVLWTFTFLSFANDVVAFDPLTLAIQWAITLHAMVCTVLMLASWAPQRVGALETSDFAGQAWLRRAVAAGLLAAVAASFAGWGVKRALFGDAFAGYFYTNHIRFGAGNTNDKR